MNWLRNLRIVIALVAFATANAFAGSFFPPAYAWSESTGWINFAPTSGGGVTVTNATLTGFAWSENLGWIDFSPTSGGVLNDGAGNLSGFAWSENAGWINFAPSGTSVTIDGATRALTGFAWGENIGWINFSVPSPLVTTFGLPPDADNDGVPNDVELTEGLNPLAKDNDIFGNARLFAMQQYRDFLGREGDAAGIVSFTSYVNGGGSRAAVIEGFFGSPEFQGTGSPVVRLYFAYFLRIPDYGGLTFWMDYFRAGHSLIEISNAFAGSQEFISRYGTLTNDQFVDLVYQNVLNRPADASGKAYWLGQLNAGMTRGEMMTGFSESAEFQSAIFSETYVTMMYVGMLKRAPDSGGFNFWVNYLDQGNSGQALINNFLVALEYHNRFLP